MPASSALFALLMLLNLLIGTLMAMLTDSGGIMGFLQSLFQLAMMLGSLYLVLKWLSKLNRFNQTGSALMLIELLFTLLALPLVSWYQRTTSTESGLLMLILLFWNIVVMGHILRHTFELDLNIGIAAAVLYTLLTWNITPLLFPVSG
jgi:FtsH-binding integral membrane protein